MRNISLVAIGLMLVLFSLPVMSALWAGGENSITNVTGNLTPLDFVMTTIQSTTNPGIGQNVTYVTSIVISARAHARFNLTNFSINMPDNNTVSIISTILLTNATAGGIGNVTAQVYTIAQATGQNGYISFYGISAFSGATPALNGTANATVWNLTWIAETPIASTKIATSLSGRTYTETWNITSANSDITITNASLVVTPSRYNLRIGVPTAVTFNSTSLTTSGYTTNYTDLEAWTDLNIGASGNMLEYGSGYETLSISYNGPIISTSSGSSPSALVSVVPTTVKQVSLWLLMGLGFVIVIGGVVFLVLKTGKRKR